MYVYIYIYFICTFSRRNMVVVVVVQDTIYVHYHYGTLARSENPGLEISLWLEKEKDKKGKILALRRKSCIKFEAKAGLMVIVEEDWLHKMIIVMLNLIWKLLSKVSVLKMPAAKFFRQNLTPVYHQMNSSGSKEKITLHILLLRTLNCSGSFPN